MLTHRPASGYGGWTPGDAFSITSQCLTSNPPAQPTLLVAVTEACRLYEDMPNAMVHPNIMNLNALLSATADHFDCWVRVNF